jgi:hypothetical protein
MTSARAVLFRICHQLRSHRWNGWPLDLWLSFALVLIAGLASLGIVPGQRATIYGMAAGLLILWALVLWAQGRSFVLFQAEDFPTSPGPAAPLQPTDRIELRATGSFEVEGKRHRFSELLAYFRTFATREHAVMAIVPPSRFLLIGTRPEQEVGMWYIFFRPRQILELAPGTLRYGLQASPALRVAFQVEDGQDTVYLSFGDHATRQRVWADLHKDAPVNAQAEQPDLEEAALE